MSTRRRQFALAACAAFVALAGAASQARAATDYAIDTVTDGLRYPWSVVFLPDGELLVSERGGQVRVIHRGNLRTEPLSGVPAVFERSQGGLFDLLLHPRFERNRRIYLTYAHGNAKRNTLRVARATLSGHALRDLEVVFESAPSRDTPVHYGGRMTFMPDGTLLVTTGDGFDYREAAQRLDNLLGKIVRLNDDGSLPDDNPFVHRAGARPEIWSYGHRNPQGIVVTDDGRVYAHEHGPRGGDELNLIQPGRNYGWPVITYGMDYSGAYVTPYTEYPGMEQPLLHWTPSIAPAGMTWYDGAVFPAWKGDLFVAALVEQSVRRVDLEDGAIAGQELLFTEIGARLRDVRTGPDGHLYVLTDEERGRLLRIRPAP